MRAVFPPVLQLQPDSGAGTSGPAPESTADVEPSLYDLSEAGRAAQRAEQERQRRRPDRHSKSLVIVNTGAGKGKTTAALGLLFRAWGQNLRVVMLQFLKAQTGNWGEVKAARKLGVEIIPLGDGFTWLSKDLDQDRALAQQCWQRCREVIEAGQHDVVIMDEMTYCFKFGWLDLAEVLDVLARRPAHLHVVITGRDAPTELIAFADLVTEMREIKHPYKAGVKAQKGIEF